jgi:ribosomal-protein-alanine N-acetyltransferase
MNISIQPATGADASCIASMSARLIEYGLPQSWRAHRVEKHIRSRNSVVLTACSPERLAGFAIMRFGDDSAHLNLLAVEPDFQRSGIGRDLVAWLEDSAVVAGAFHVSLEARADNAAALRFYAALGYHETGVIPNYYNGIVDAAQLARDLRVCPRLSDPLPR